MSRLSSKAMLAELSVRKWGASKSDRAASSEFAVSKNSNPALTRVTKTLMQSPHLVGFDQLANQARGVHYAYTLPWLDSGGRILPVKKWLDYGKEIKAIKEKSESCVNDLCDAYPQIIKQFKTQLGDLFKAKDYPDVEYVRSKFGIGMRFMPLPDATDWRVDLAASDMAILKDELRDSFVDSQKRAVDDMALKIREKLERLQEILNDGDESMRRRLRETHLAGLVELPEWITTMNVFDDPILTKLGKKLDSELDFNFDADGIKEDPTLRKDLLAAINRLIKELPEVHA